MKARPTPPILIETDDAVIDAQCCLMDAYKHLQEADVKLREFHHHWRRLDREVKTGERAA